MSKVVFDRTPYNVSYMKDGERHTIRRVPPPKQHNVWPEDKVVLQRTKNDDFKEGDELDVSAISPRQPNVLQLNKEGVSEHTFIDYYDVELKEQVPRTPDGEKIDIKTTPIGNRYLLWP